MRALQTTRPARSVSVLAYDGMSAFELGIVTEVFGLPRPELDVSWYELTVCAQGPGPVRVVGGAFLDTPHGLEVFSAAHTVIVPGVSDVTGDPSPEVTAALRLAHQRGARVVSICSGAFALAAAGLLDGRRATTHWRYADLLSRRYPQVRVDANALYIDEHDVITGAGSAAGLDVCTHLVRKDHGAAVANAVARRLVVQPHRDGGQAQYIETPVTAGPDDDRLTRDYGHIVLEDLGVRGMTASASGTIEEPGSRVAQKSGLNKAILDKGWYGLEVALRSKARYTGSVIGKVPAAYTSQTCSAPACGKVDAKSRESQALFRCTTCGYTEHADVNAAKCIKARGQAAGPVVSGRGDSGLPGSVKRQAPRSIARGAPRAAA
ncbi:zinc ribbon domain-containing protein [Streptosporangium sp. NPDC087985]|uniref:zinc ribbon domain-containing protein n=1 Tax=Streptosporangium sp. NPDC087985 TaxID=3366196 RepID=UPI00381D135B